MTYYSKALVDSLDLNKFLNDNNAYDAYIIATTRQIKKDTVLGTVKYLYNEKQASKYDLISYAFTWGATEQGYEYWRNLSDKWNKYIDNNNEYVNNDCKYNKQCKSIW